MKKIISLATLVTVVAPKLAAAVTFSSDGAVLLGDSEPAVNNNVIAAIGGANLSLDCLLIVALMIAAIYIFHSLWHPRRLHEEMDEKEVVQGSIRFYIGGSFIWILAAIMAEAWCVILPLTLIIIAALIYHYLVSGDYVSLEKEEN